MLRCLLSAIPCLILLAQGALGASIGLFDGLPTSYTPGQPVTFDVRLPAISDLGSYNIDLVLESNAGTAGVDFFFDVAATVPAAANYVFPSSANYFDAAIVDSPTRHRITLTDFDLVGASVVTGVNDRVATVVFQTAPTFSGELGLFVDAPLLILDTPDITPTPVQEFDQILDSLPPPITLPVVPEPSSALLVWSAFLCGLGTMRRRSAK